MIAYIKILAGLALIGLVIWQIWFAPYDDTDPPGERSGLDVYTDHKTGCQYIRAGGFFGGALTPRLDANGKPICTPQNAESATERKS